MAPLPYPDEGMSLLAHILLPRTPSDATSSSSSSSSSFASILKRHPSPFQPSQLHARQSSALIPENYTNRDSGPSPGTVAGIVLGSVAGFLLILWLLYTCFAGGSIFPTTQSEGSVVIREHRKSNRSHSTRSRRVSEVREVRTAAPVERIVVTEERRERRASRPMVVESSDGSTVDEVVVIEEHSPPRRARSKRESGYRNVDPLAYGGGDRPMRKVSSSRRSRG